MWLLTLAGVALLVGADLRLRGQEFCRATIQGSPSDLTGQNVAAIGSWISFAGGICLNIAVWQLF
jgi:hypothetical protein